MSAAWEPLWPIVEPKVRQAQPQRFRWPKAGADGWIGAVHSPLREDRNPSFSVKPDTASDPGAWKDYATSEHGSMADLAERLGIDPHQSQREPLEPPRPEPERTMAEFCRRRRLDESRLRSDFRVDETEHAGRPALRFPTRHGYRVKYLDGEKPKAGWVKSGGVAHAYGLPRARRIGGHTLYLVNGEPSCWAALQSGVPAVCTCGGEGSLPATVVEKLAAAGFQRVAVVFDRDQAGRKGARQAAGVLREAGLEAVALELPVALGPGGDVDDLHRAVGDDGLRQALAELPELRDDGQAVQAVAGTGGDDWPEALPLHRDLPPPEAYPVAALGDVLGPMAQTIHDIVRSPLEMCCQSVLAAAALAVQAHADVEIDGRRYPTSLSAVTVAESGERKSATDRQALAPHRKRQDQLVELHGTLHEQYAADLDAYKAARAETLKKGKGRTGKREALLELGPEPEAPSTPMLITTEPSVEGLKKLLATGQPSIGLFSDEGATFVNGFSMGDDRRLGTLGSLSKLWDGDPIDRVRSLDGSSMLYGRRVSSHLMMQPVAAERLLGDQLAAGQGYLARCLLVWPKSAAGTMTYVEADVSSTAEARRYFGRMMALLEMEPTTAERDRRELRPRPLTLEPEAKAQWIRFHDWVQKQLVPDGVLRPVQAFAAKAAEHALRIAGVLAVVEDIHTSTVTRQTVDAAITTMRFYLSEALRLRAVGETAPELAAAVSLLDWMQTQPSRFTPVRTVYQYGPNAVRDAKTARSLLALLTEHGWVRPVGQMEIDGTKHREVWEVRP